MRHIFLFILIVFLLSGFSSARAAELFFESLYDVPIMRGLEELPELALSFDKPDGRISQAGAIAAPNLQEKDILAFYDQALSQMGWQKETKSSYYREFDKLTIDFKTLSPKNQEKQDSLLLVKFSLEPLE